MNGFRMSVALDILSGEEDLPFDLTLDLPVPQAQVPLPLISILNPTAPAPHKSF